MWVSAMYGSWWTGWTKSPSDLGRSFNRCRDIALDVESDGRLTELLSELDLRGVDRSTGIMH